MTLLEALLSIKENVLDTTIGLCGNVLQAALKADYSFRQAEDLECELRALFQHMGLCSKYPVTHPDDKGFHAAENYYIAAEDKWIGVYGDARRALLDQCIAYLEENRDV